ncbi:fatty acid desaturase [Rubritalea halochordaticola]|uniref:Fatty acid desaturase n=1 Tax=Rubritalea halochordaticola TaxID=714537 RepID=A0ABP9V2A1_9BACT
MASKEPSRAGDKEQRREEVARWKAIVSEFQKPNAWRASWQILNSIGGYGVLWYLMYLSLSVSWWLTIPLALLAAGFLIRIFIIFHDCGHGSFYKSAKANHFWGFVTGLLTFTPYYHWKWEHSIHHATAGNLERRGVGDVMTLTVREYLESSRWKKFSYRLSRNPFILFVIAPLLIFLIMQRFPSAKAKRRERISVHTMNLAIILLAAGLITVFGFIPWLVIQVVIMSVAGSGGFWLFYVQHQYEDAYWEHAEAWEYTDAAIKGSSYYKLPKVLQWFTGNIGFHHIHHLSPRIPNYNLERCHRSHPMFEEVKPMTLFRSLKSISLRLWDEKTHKLISFGKLKRQRKNDQGGEES